MKVLRLRPRQFDIGNFGIIISFRSECFFGRVQVRDKPLKQLIKKSWKGWSRVLVKIGRLQGRIIFSLVYVIGVTPIALVFKLVADPLRMKGRRDSNWVSRETHLDSIDSARRQF
jgi:hypothetical protein